MLKRVALASVLALLLCGCGPDVIQLSEVDNGKTIACSKGDQLVITLPANPSTGFTWQVYRQPSSEHLVLTRSEFNETPGSRNMVGVPGTYSFFYTITGAGKEGISLIYCRTWEDRAPSGRFEILVDAAE